jgi:DNA-binding winged helix-turn-helix (wHTH) protein
MHTPPVRPEHYDFGRFCLNTEGTLLTCDGEALPLAPKVLQTLLVLVQRAGRIVPKDELIAGVWPRTFVEETGLTRNISLLRRALGEEANRQVTQLAAATQHGRPLLWTLGVSTLELTRDATRARRRDEHA